MIEGIPVKENGQLNTAPVLITTLCRYEHFVRLVESLKKSELAKETDLYVGLDYPLKESHEKGRAQISDYLDGLTGFRKVVVIRHDHNVGSMMNIRLSREVLFEENDKYIFSEDDNEFSPGYLEFMNKALVEYESDDKIVAVSGYNYPIEMGGEAGDVYRMKTYYSAFGFGTWKNKRLNLENSITYEDFYKNYCNVHKMMQLRKISKNQYTNYVKGMLRYIGELVNDNKEVSKIDLSYGLHMFMHGEYMLFPFVSKVRNWGYDGSGEHCAEMNVDEEKAISYRNYNYSMQPIDMDEFPGIITERTVDEAEIDRKLDIFFEVQKKEMLRTDIAYFLSRIIGIDNTARLLSKVTDR